MIFKFLRKLWKKVFYRAFLFHAKTQRFRKDAIQHVVFFAFAFLRGIKISDDVVLHARPGKSAVILALTDRYLKLMRMWLWRCGRPQWVECPVQLPVRNQQ